MIRRISNTFRAVTAFPTTNMTDVNIWDDTNLDTSPVSLTQGATLIDQIRFPRTNPLSVLSMSVSGRLYCFNNLGPNFQPYGKLGAIQVGLTQQPATPPGIVGPFSLSFKSFPADATMATPLFDPANDNLPPVLAATSAYNPAAYLPVSQSLNLPQPLALQSGSPLGVGIWMEPSLLPTAGNSNVQFILVLAGAAYTIVYDDQVQAQGPTA